MLLRIIRTQVTAIGTLHAGVSYNLPDKDSVAKQVAKRLLDRGFAREVTQKQLKAEKVEAENVTGPGVDDAGKTSAVK